MTHHQKLALFILSGVATATLFKGLHVHPYDAPFYAPLGLPLFPSVWFCGFLASYALVRCYTFKKQWRHTFLACASGAMMLLILILSEPILIYPSFYTILYRSWLSIASHMAMALFLAWGFGSVLLGIIAALQHGTRYIWALHEPSWPDF